VAGYLRHSIAESERLRALLAEFSRGTTAWLASVFPRYAAGWQLDRVSFRPEEEATRQLRTTARNDLLHVDAFPSRPTNGHRILRVFANVNPVEPRVWATSEPFGKLLARYGRQAGLPMAQGEGFVERLRRGALGLFRPGRQRRSPYDQFMLRFHNFLKFHEDFQEHSPKRFWKFPPESAWLALTDTTSHAALRGRYALEHSYFLAPETLVLPTESPPALLEKACGIPVLCRAA
jgi:hypothetical protein